MAWTLPWNRQRARDEPRVTLMHGLIRKRADRMLSGSEAIYAAVSRISNTIASLPLNLYKGDSIAGEHDLERLIAYEPNPMMTAYTFRQAMEAYRNTEGTAYALIVPDASDRPVRLDVLDPAHVTPMREKETQEVWYDIQFENGDRIRVHHSRVIALQHMSANGERGIRPIDVLRGTLQYDQKIREFSLKQMDGVNSGVILTVPGQGLSQDRKRTVIEQFLTAYRESGGQVVILEGGVDAKMFQSSPVDPKVLDVEKITRNRVATVYNLPPHMLGNFEGLSYNTAEQLMLEYLQMTVQPIVRQWEDELNRKLLTWEMLRQGYAFRFTLSDFWRADAQTMADRYQKGIRGGWFTPNEVRRMEGLPADPDGNELLVARDMVPLRVVRQQETME